MAEQLDDQRRAQSARTPDLNNPYAPPYQRPARRTGRPYRDPVGQYATGAANSTDKEGLIARARAARREEMERRR